MVWDGPAIVYWYGMGLPVSRRLTVLQVSYMAWDGPAIVYWYGLGLPVGRRLTVMPTSHMAGVGPATRLHGMGWACHRVLVWVGPTTYLRFPRFVGIIFGMRIGLPWSTLWNGAVYYPVGLCLLLCKFLVVIYCGPVRTTLCNIRSCVFCAP